MSIKEQMDDIPQPVTYEPQGEWTSVLLRTDIKKHTEGEGKDARTYYTDRLTRIIVRSETLTEAVRADIERDPAAYVQRIEVEDVKPEIESKVQAWIDKAVVTRAAVPCEGIPNGIVYDQQACLVALGLEEGDTFTDAKNGLHLVTAELITAVKTGIKRYVSGIYAKATAWRTRITNATTRAELDAIAQEVECSLHP